MNSVASNATESMVHSHLVFLQTIASIPPDNKIHWDGMSFHYVPNTLLNVFLRTVYYSDTRYVALGKIETRITEMTRQFRDLLEKEDSRPSTISFHSWRYFLTVLKRAKDYGLPNWCRNYINDAVITSGITALINTEIPPLEDIITSYLKSNEALETSNSASAIIDIPVLRPVRSSPSGKNSFNSSSHPYTRPGSYPAESPFIFDPPTLQEPNGHQLDSDDTPLDDQNDEEESTQTLNNLLLLREQSQVTEC